MRRSTILATVFATVLLLVLPFFGGSGPSPLSTSANADSFSSGFDSVMQPIAAAPVGSTVVADSDVAVAAFSTYTPEVVEPVLTTDAEHLAQKPVPPPPPPVVRAAAGLSCPGNVGGAPGSAPSAVSGGGVAGTTSADLASFAANYNAIRVANCLNPVPLANFRYDACMEARLFWIAEDPSPDPNSAWGHVGTVVRSDGVPDTGCDGNLAGGTGNTGATVAAKWWASTPHRNSLYRPTVTGSTAGVCIYFAMTHGGVNEPVPLNRAAARWGGC